MRSASLYDMEADLNIFNTHTHIIFMEIIAAEEIVEAMEGMRDEVQRRVLCRFFKTGKGEYGEGDEFLGLKVPVTRGVAKEARLRVPLAEIDKLLASRWHEVRLCGFLLLVEEMAAALPKRGVDTRDKAMRREEIVRFYLAHARQANNWDLVDLSCGYIVGVWMLHPLPSSEDAQSPSMPDRSLLDRLADSDNLWEQRIAIVSTSALIRAGQYADTLRIATRLLGHPHDLIHKAVGWMLREVGKKDVEVLRDYLDRYCLEMARTTLRYAIERFDEGERHYWLKRK